MARKSKKRRRLQRDTAQIIAKRSAPSLLKSRAFKTMRSKVRRNRYELENDRRFFRPAISTEIRKLSGGPAEIYIKYDRRAGVRSGVLPHGLSFRSPARVDACVRRRRRREALFARGHAGFGRSIRTPKRLNNYSDVSC